MTALEEQVTSFTSIQDQDTPNISTPRESTPRSKSVTFGDDVNSKRTETPDETPKGDGIKFGTIRFIELSSVLNYYSIREFAIVGKDALHNEDSNRIAQYLTKICRHLPSDEPKLVISLVGGYRGVKHVSTRIKKIFLRELANAILSTGAWLLTGGLHSDMTKDVGEALRDYAIGRALAENKQVVAIGITPLSAVEQRKALKERDSEIVIAIDDPKANGNPQLDPNHSHYLLIDDGDDKSDQKIPSVGIASTAQNRFLKVVKQMNSKNDSKSEVPVVCILVGGDHRRIKAIHETVVENKIPVLILDGSGGAANVIAFASRELGNKGINQSGALSVKTANEFKVQLSTEFRNEEIGSNHTQLRTWCREIVEKKHLVTVLESGESFNADNSRTNLEEKMLTAMFKAKKLRTLNAPGHYADQLHLATILNRLDLAQQVLQKEETIKVIDVRQTLRSALVNNQVEFVRLFLTKGLDFRDYLTEQELVGLYTTVKVETLLHELLIDHLETSSRNSIMQVELKDIGNVINDLTTWSFQPLYLEEEKRLKDDDDRFHRPFRELFLWAVLQGRLEMALFFWEESKAPIGGALVAGTLLKEMAKKEATLHESRRLTRYEEGARLFDKLAVEVLTEYYQSDRKRTAFSLVRVLHTWGSAISLDLAKTAYNMEFIGHPAVQNMLKAFWMGNLSLSNPRWKIWICLVFPPALLFIRLKLKEEEIDPLRVKRLPRGRSTGAIKVRRPDLLRRISTRIPATASWVRQSRHSDGTDTDDHNFTGLPQREMNNRKRIRVYENDNKKPQVSVYRRAVTFFRVPLVIFLYNVFSMLVFLALYSYTLLQGFETEYHSVLEYVLLAWFATLCLEFIRQILWEVGPTYWYRFGIWINNFWSKIDVCKTIVFITGFLLRCFPQTVFYGRIVLALGLIFFYIRLLHVCSANHSVGPKLVMIQKMFTDLAVFVSILLVFLTAYGVAREAILYPGRVGASSVLENIFYRPYLQMFGELLQSTESDECYMREVGNATNPESVEVCQQHPWIGMILLSVYLFLCNVLLLSLLIAMFNFTFVTVQEKTDIHWKWQRYKLIEEYHKRPVLAPPFIIISHILLLVKGSCKLLHKLCNTCIKVKAPESDRTNRELAIWESVKGEDYLAKKRQKEQAKIDTKLLSNQNRLLEMSQHMTRIEQQVKEEKDEIKAVKEQILSEMSRQMTQIKQEKEEMKAVKEQLKTVQSLLEATMKQLQNQK